MNRDKHIQLFKTVINYCRKAINENKYDIFNACEDVSTLTSLVKLYLREIPGRLINSDVIEYIKSERVDLSSNGDKSNLVYHMRKSLEHIEQLPSVVLHFILLHAKHVSDVPGTFLYHYEHQNILDCETTSNDLLCLFRKQDGY